MIVAARDALDPDAHIFPMAFAFFFTMNSSQGNVKTMAGAIPRTFPIGFLQQKPRGCEFDTRIALQGLLLKLNSWRCDCGAAQTPGFRAGCTPVRSAATP